MAGEMTDAQRMADAVTLAASYLAEPVPDMSRALLYVAHRLREQAAEVGRLRAEAAPCCYAVEYGAHSLPFGDPSRITCVEVFQTLDAAREFAANGEFSSRVLACREVPPPSADALPLWRADTPQPPARGEEPTR